MLSAQWLVVVPSFLPVSHRFPQIVRNFMELITSPTFGAPGFVPNGGRTYYLSRSQPPLLSEMVSAVYNVTHDTEFLAYVPCSPTSSSPLLHVREWLRHREGVAALDMEYAHWMKKGAFGNAVEIVTNSKQVTLNRYVTNWTHPRPESWVEDTETARAAGYNPANESDPGLQEMYRRIAAMAESGWDFSSRYVIDCSVHIDHLTSDAHLSLPL